MKYHHSMTYRESLDKLGYPLQDCGSHWRTRAIYRNGKTNTSVIIYKDSGVWKDFGTDSQAKPFSALVQETLNTNDPAIHFATASVTAFKLILSFRRNASFFIKSFHWQKFVQI